jgi:Protein of unknown function (DUF4058)
MPIYDWTRVQAGGFHNFHQDWTIEIYRALNRGILPNGYTAYTDLRIQGWEPDAVAIQHGEPTTPGGLAVAVAPPQAKQVARIETDRAAYARKANRIVVKQEYGEVVGVLEVLSPGNKDSAHAMRSFLAKTVEFLRNGVNLVVVDLFPPTARDPQGIHHAIWGEMTDLPFEPRPSDKPLTVAGYDVGSGFAAYVNPVAVGERLPDVPLFLAPGWYVNVPLESTYESAWAVTPMPIRQRVEPTLAPSGSVSGS